MSRRRHLHTYMFLFFLSIILSHTACMGSLFEFNLINGLRVRDAHDAHEKMTSSGKSVLSIKDPTPCAMRRSAKNIARRCCLRRSDARASVGVSACVRIRGVAKGSARCQLCTWRVAPLLNDSPEPTKKFLHPLLVAHVVHRPRASILVKPSTQTLTRLCVLQHESAITTLSYCAECYA